MTHEECFASVYDNSLNIWTLHFFSKSKKDTLYVDIPRFKLSKTQHYYGTQKNNEKQL